MTTGELRTPPMDTVERVARALCEADGWADPDDHVIGGQAQGFEDYGPRWKAVSNGCLGDPDYVKLATAAISAYRAAQWQGIETAPKDGTRVLIFSEGHVCIAYWSEDAYFGETEYARPGWQIFNCEMDHWYSVATETPTHWQPLPEPPKGEEG